MSRSKLEAVVFFGDIRGNDHQLPKMTVGIDQEQWVIGPVFKGFKLIPHGFHLITISVMGSFNQCGMTTSFAIWIDDRAMVHPTFVLLYDPLTETWSCSNDPAVTGSINERYSFWDNFLAAYSSKNNRLFQLSIIRDSVTYVCDDIVSFYHPDPYDRHHISRIDSTTTLHFPSIQLHASYPPNSTPSLITKYSLDKSYLLSKLLQSFPPSELLSYFSLSFLLFLYAQNITGLDFWKKFFCLICHSQDAISENGTADLITQWMDLVLMHLKVLDMAAFDDSMSQVFLCPLNDGDTNPWIFDALTTLFMNIDDVVESSRHHHLDALRQKSLQFQSEMEKILSSTILRSIDEPIDVLNIAPDTQ